MNLEFAADGIKIADECLITIDSLGMGSMKKYFCFNFLCDNK